jgi:hypothetical protein
MFPQKIVIADHLELDFRVREAVLHLEALRRRLLARATLRLGRRHCGGRAGNDVRVVDAFVAVQNVQLESN